MSRLEGGREREREWRKGREGRIDVIYNLELGRQHRIARQNLEKIQNQFKSNEEDLLLLRKVSTCK